MRMNGGALIYGEINQVNLPFKPFGSATEKKERESDGE